MVTGALVGKAGGRGGIKLAAQVPESLGLALIIAQVMYKI